MIHPCGVLLWKSIFTIIKVLWTTKKPVCIHASSVFLFLPDACYDLYLLSSCNGHLCTVIQTSSLLLALLPPQLAPKTFCSELEDKSRTVPSLRRVPMRLYICHCFHFDFGIRVSHHGVCFIVFRALGEKVAKVLISSGGPAFCRPLLGLLCLA